MTEIEKFWINFQEKLQNKGRIVGVRLHFSKAKNKFGCDGETRDGLKFHLTVGTGFCFIILHFSASEGDASDLIRALIKVSGYSPFCRYVEDEMTLIEWNDGDPEKYFSTLIKANKESLQRIPKSFYQEKTCATAQA
ncbi:MAG TPA: hypothetical protein DIC35_02460 [Candidatus Moranbacteria bacterium]|nr:hypothetical protein [Candidatus Moranbacteria bacterium]